MSTIFLKGNLVHERRIIGLKSLAIEGKKYETEEFDEIEVSTIICKNSRKDLETKLGGVVSSRSSYVGTNKCRGSKKHQD